jgi:hypothetical protein
MNTINHKRKTHKQFVEKLKFIQPNLKVLSNYYNSYTKINVSDQHNIIYSVVPNELLRNSSPNIRSALDKNLAFKALANNKHNNKYNYNLVNYKNDKTKISIKCFIHGNFEQRPVDHLVGNGCLKCAKENHPGGYASIYKYSSNTETYIYLFECYNEKEKFYKVGLSLNPKLRIHNIPYKINIIGVSKGIVKDLYPLEQNYHKKFKQLSIQYIPEIYFQGYTECFKINNNEKISES